jgi:hypothetical protein
MLAAQARAERGVAAELRVRPTPEERAVLAEVRGPEESAVLVVMLARVALAVARALEGQVAEPKRLAVLPEAVVRKRMERRVRPMAALGLKAARTVARWASSPGAAPA